MANDHEWLNVLLKCLLQQICNMHCYLSALSAEMQNNDVTQVVKYPNYQ